MKTMHFVHFGLGLALGAAACTVQAQQQTMPAMPMPPQQTKPQAPAPMPPRASDIKSMGHDKSDPRANAAAASEQNSAAQQAGQSGMPGASSDAASITVPFADVQEPEAVGFHTGTDLPAPELLGDVVLRQPMTVEQFVTLADTNTPTLAQAQANLDRSAQQARQAGLPPNPTVGYSGDHIRGGSYNGGEEGAFFSQEFVLGHKLALRRAVYQAEGRANEYALAVQRARVHNDVARDFFAALAAEESVTIEDRLLKTAQDAETNAHELERVGQADASAALTAEVAEEQAAMDFETAQRMFLADFAQLATAAGQVNLAPHPLAGRFVEPPAIDADAMVADDVQQSPAVKQAQAEIATAEARLKDAHRERVPNLTVKAGEWYSGETLGATNNKAGWESFAEAGVQLPLWNRNQGNIGAADAEVARARQEVTRVQLATRNRAEPYAQQYLTARSTAERYRTEMLPRARRAYQLEAMKYQQMALAYPPVLAAQHMLFALQLSYVEALSREWSAAIALQNYTLTDGLDRPLSMGQDATSQNLPTGGTQ